jgi:hypothetical protein
MDITLHCAWKDAYGTGERGGAGCEWLDALEPNCLTSGTAVLHVIERREK